MGSRHYINKFEDYSSSACHNIVDHDTNTIHEAFEFLLVSEIEKLIKILKENEKKWRNSNDYSVYTGLAGIAYTLHHYGKYYNDSDYIKTATELLKKCTKYAEIENRPEITFLIGVAGPFALTAVILHSQGRIEDANKLILKLKSLSTYALDKHQQTSKKRYPDELLYGRAGYLSALLYINANISPAPIEADLIIEVISCIFDSGITYASSNRFCESPLMYSWYDTEYIGGAHGLAGILYLLLQARQYLTKVQLNSYVKPSLHYLQKLQFPSGNFPASTDDSSDKLLHWCHGAPGMPALFCLAHKVFEDNTFLEVAIQCGEVIWQRGLLKKGYSICHGVAGNGYTFIHLFQHTKDIKYLYRACKFAEWCFHYGSHQSHPPDRPFSLFEGLAGVIYFLIDLRQPFSAKFPAYDI